MGETIFYDVVCGLPLFIAPRGRSFADFQAESLHHGWPSFRPEEMISENVILHEDGRMESVCLTHLGHNLPESGVDRYCIDLVCIAGSPLTVSEGNLTKQFPSLLMVDGKEEEQNKEVSTESSESDSASTSDTATTTTATDSFGSVSGSGIVTSDSLLEDPNEYVSSAEQNSGKVSHKKRNIIIGVVIGVICLGIIISFLWYTNSSGASKNNKNKDKDNNSTHKDVENNNTINDNDNDTSNEVEE